MCDDVTDLNHGKDDSSDFMIQPFVTAVLASNELLYARKSLVPGIITPPTFPGTWIKALLSMHIQGS